LELVLSAGEAKEIDRISIQEIGIPSVVLMEKAAMAVAECVEDICSCKSKPLPFNKCLPSVKQDIKILAICGTGNNGGDGVACARILEEKGYNTSVFLAGNIKKATEEMERQLSVARALGVDMVTQLKDNEYSIIIDALFGTGLSRDIKGEYAEWVSWINSQASSVIVSADIPSGIDADNGKIYGCAVKADYTVTFGNNKRGIVLFPGVSYSGNVIVADIGFPKKAVRKTSPKAFTYRKEDLKSLMPPRRMRTNKGSYGKVLVIAGSSGMCGACYFAAKAAYRTGCGLVKIATAPQNISVLQAKLPEAITGSYEDGITSALEWADIIAAGPGIGTDSSAIRLVQEVLKEKEKPVVMDADALNVLPYITGNISSQDNKEAGAVNNTGVINTIDSYNLGSNFIITPHLKEMAGLTGADINDIKENIVCYASSHKSGCTIVLKDARTVVSDGDSIYINTSGNNALATGGSGDVLCGIIAGLLAQGIPVMEAAALAVFIHGLSAELYTETKSRYSMVASDIIEELPYVLPY